MAGETAKLLLWVRDAEWGRSCWYRYKRLSVRPGRESLLRRREKTRHRDLLSIIDTILQVGCSGFNYEGFGHVRSFDGAQMSGTRALTSYDHASGIRLHLPEVSHGRMVGIRSRALLTSTGKRHTHSSILITLGFSLSRILCQSRLFLDS